ncbi:MAG TPA: LamG domain-containing protein [Longimicrobiales bacterium]
MLVSTHTIVNESASAAVDQPYSFGLGFGPGAVPAGWRLVGEMPDGTPVTLQVDDRSHWPDGSLKHGRISCIVPNVPAGGAIALRVLREEGAWNNASTRTIADVTGNAANDLRVWTALGVGGLFDALNGSRVKVVSRGPVMTEWEAVQPITSLIEVRWHVRLWELPEAPIQYVAAVEQHKMWTANQKQVYAARLEGPGGAVIHDYGSITHIEHSAWFTVDDAGRMRWIGIPTPPLSGRINKAHWTATGLIPNFDPTIVMESPDDPTLLSYRPMGRHDLREAFDGTAGHPQIGPVTNWFARAFVSGGAPGYMRRSRINALSFAHTPCSWRDDGVGMEVANLLPRTSGPEGDWSVLGPGHPNTYAGSGYNNSYGLSPDLPAHDRDVTPEFVHQFDSTHYPSLPAWHWLIEGERHWLNLLHLDADWHILQWRLREKTVGGQTFHGVIVLKSQTRGDAWGIREVLLAAALTPDEVADPNDPVPAIGAYFRAVRNENTGFALARIATEFAGLEHMGLWNDSISGQEDYILSTWQHDFLIITVGMGYLASRDPNLKAWVEHLAKWRIGLLDPIVGCPYWASPYKHAVRRFYGSAEWVDDFSKVMVHLGTVRFDDTTNRITFDDWPADRLRDGVLIQFSHATPPTGLSLQQNYYIRDFDPATRSFSVAETPGGPVVSFDGAPTGVHINIHFPPDTCSPDGMFGNYSYGYGGIARCACAVAHNCGVPGAREAFDIIEARRGSTIDDQVGDPTGANGPYFAVVPFDGAPVPNLLADRTMPIRWAGVIARPGGWQFNEGGAHAVVGAHPALTLPAGDWALGGWVNPTPDNQTGLDYYLSWGGNPGEPGNLNLWIDESPNSWNWEIHDGSIGSGIVGADLPEPTTGWHYVLLQRQGDVVALYVNGQAQGDPWSAPGLGAISFAAPLYIGARQDQDASRFFGGGLQAWGKWDRALTAQEIADLAGGLHPTDVPGLTWFLPMESGGPDGDYSETVAGLTVTPNGIGTAPNRAPLQAPSGAPVIADRAVAAAWLGSAVASAPVPVHWGVAETEPEPVFVEGNPAVFVAEARPTVWRRDPPSD